MQRYKKDKRISEKKSMEKFKIFTLKRHFRYIKIFFNIQIIILIIMTSSISNTIVLFKNQKFENLYEEKTYNNIEGIVKSDVKESEYSNTYVVQVLKIDGDGIYKNTLIYIRINKNQDIGLEYGNYINFIGEYLRPDVQRNRNGFDYSKYLKTLNIYGTIKIEKIYSVDESNNSFLGMVNSISNHLSYIIEDTLDYETASIINGLVLGKTEKIEDEVKEDFSSANISHILAISGMHISYLIMFFEKILSKILGKMRSRVVIILLIIIYILITGFSPSIIRAGIMAVLIIISKIIHSKNDFYNGISVSLVLILMSNPYIIMNQGLQFSYVATVGIVVMYDMILNLLKELIVNKLSSKYEKIKIILIKINEILVLTLSAQISILPIMILNYNIYNPYFLISNLLVGIVIGPIIISSFIYVFIIGTNIYIPNIFSEIIEFVIDILLKISEISELPFSKIYINTPNILQIICYYILICIILILCKSYLGRRKNNINNRIRNYVATFKFRLSENKKKVILAIIIFLIIILSINIYPNKFELNFIDVGQGDCTFITTPQNKTILIDGGGNSSFDVGKNTLIPYILDRGYTSIDYVFVSHFDSDHVKGIITLVQELKVNNIFISEQIEYSENYQELLTIIKEKNINLQILSKGDQIQIEKDIYIQILWPEKIQINENILNNNSLVMKLVYKEISILFTGDIEEIAENKILEQIPKEYLNATILKVAHHGSKTSSIEEFINVVNPQIALIGVGKNNMFGHPSNEVIERLKQNNIEIFRTDEDGEISLVIDKDKIQIDTHLNKE